jgi:hypothetical protein
LKNKKDQVKEGKSFVAQHYRAHQRNKIIYKQPGTLHTYRLPKLFIIHNATCFDSLAIIRDNINIISRFSRTLHSQQKVTKINLNKKVLIKFIHFSPVALDSPFSPRKYNMGLPKKGPR